MKITFYGPTAIPPDDCPINDMGLKWGGLGARVWAQDAESCSRDVVFGLVTGASRCDGAWSVQIHEENGDITSVPLGAVIGRAR